MLVALTNRGALFSLCNMNLTKQELFQLRKKEIFYCPSCNQEVSLKLGAKIAWHFAHKKNNSCNEELEGETPYHINGKKLLYEWFLNQGYKVQLEPYIKEAKQRPDLLVKTSNNIFAIEFQCAKISSQIFLKRTRTYQKHGYIPFWILGGNQLKRVRSNYFQLNHFHWLFSYNYFLQKSFIQILTFCPDHKLFIKLNHLSSLSTHRTFALPEFYPLESYSLQKVFQSFKPIFPLKVWLQAKGFWRQPRLRIGQAEQLVKNIYYSKGHPSKLYPAEAGVPTKYYYFIETPVFIWQCWLLELFIINKKVGDKFHLNLVYRAFQTLVQKGLFHVRQLPLMKDIGDLQAIEYYLYFLCSLKLLKTKDGKLFIKLKEIEYPNNIEQALKYDKKVLSHVEKMIFQNSSIFL